MKYIAAADLHIRKQQPRYRKDDYWLAAQKKLSWLIELSDEMGAPLLIAGDIYDAALTSTHVINVVTELLQRAYRMPIVVAGQHDLRFHTDLISSAIYNMHLSKSVYLLHQEIGNKNPPITGIGWGEEVPLNKSPILLWHKCVTPKEPPFFLEDAISADEVFNKYGEYYSYIVTGDYHVPFTAYSKKHKCWLINCGTMMRNTKDMIDYQPVVYSFDAEELSEPEEHKIPILKGELAFDLESIKYDEEHGVSLETDKLRELMDSEETSVEFEDVVWSVYHKMPEEERPSKERVGEVLANAKFSKP